MTGRCRVAILALALALAGCGRFGFDPIGDAANAPDAVFPTGPFDPPARSAQLSSSSFDDDPDLSPDLLEIYFTSDRAGGAGSCDIWTSTRPDLASAWAVPQSVPVINSGACESGPSRSLDGLALVFASTRAGGSGDLDLYLTTRPDRTAAWNPPMRIVELASPVRDAGPSANADLTSLSFYSNRGGNHDLYTSTRASPQDPWGTPIRISELATPGLDFSPHALASQTILFFASDRPGGTGSSDLWWTTRASTAEPFDPPMHLDELSSVFYDDDPWVSPDGHTIWFTREDASGDADLFEATR
jgi:Tol biopolymer transport system component